jgi:hypothetical protein
MGHIFALKICQNFMAKKSVGNPNPLLTIFTPLPPKIVIFPKICAQIPLATAGPINIDWEWGEGNRGGNWQQWK